MKNVIKNIWGGVNIALILAVAFLAIALAGVKLVGLDVYVILSGSMEPEYQTGGVIYIKDVEDTSTLQSGDVITYTISNGATVTHRIVDVVEENGQTMFQTKGDANENVDASLVPASQVIGQPVFTIPYLGRLVSLIQSPSGKFALIAVAAILLLMQFLPDLIFGEDDDEDDEEEVAKEKKRKRRNKKGSGTQSEPAPDAPNVVPDTAPNTASSGNQTPAAEPVITETGNQAEKPAPMATATSSGNQTPATEPVITETGNQPEKTAPLTTAVPSGNQKPAAKPVITETGNQLEKPAPLTTAVPPAPEPAPQPQPEPASAAANIEQPAPANDSLQSFLDMDPDEFFNSLINNAKEESNNEK